MFFVLTNIKTLVLLLLIGLASLSYSEPYTVASDITTFVTSPNTLLSAHPLWVWTIPTLLIMAFDRPLTDAYHTYIEQPAELRPETVNDRYTYKAVFALMMVGSVVSSDALLNTSVCLAESIIDSCFVAQSIKQLTGRSRPFLTSDSPYTWGHIDINPYGVHTSFPSSHATIYFSISTVLGKSLHSDLAGDALGIVFYTELTGHNHWASDMWVGYLLGKAIGTYVWNRHQQEPANKDWLVFPILFDSQTGLIPALCVSVHF